MRYRNPVIPGFYPDPSACFANGKFYLCCSSFQYFPGVPLFESVDLVNWKQLGHVLTRRSQVMLEGVWSSGGVFAPTLRYHNGRFYVITNNNSTGENFYVYTDDVTGPWSDPITVEQDGIDPSLLFDGERCFFISNGTDDSGEGGIVQCEIDIETGRKLSPTRCLWKGSGGRYLESPHMYHVGAYYYLMAAEGGTEYGHMVTLARSSSPWGPFEGCPFNPILTNRNKGPFMIQGIGHGDLVQTEAGDWYILCLGFRQNSEWGPYHHLGREVYLVPARFTGDGWLRAGEDGVCTEYFEIPGAFRQEPLPELTFENTAWDRDWVFLRHPAEENYSLRRGEAVLRGSPVTLDEPLSPTFLGTRQRGFEGSLRVSIHIEGEGEAGVTAYMCESEHYDICLAGKGDTAAGRLRLNVGDVRHLEREVPLAERDAELRIDFEKEWYHFSLVSRGEAYALGSARCKYLSSEVAGGFTGVLFGLYAVGGVEARFTELRCAYKE